MDKYEYKIRAEEIRNLIAQEEYLEAAKIADSIDWTCVKKVGTLCTISDLYKKVRRYEDAIELLKLADERSPEAKDITYSLCELYIKTGDVVNAVESYKAFVRIGARDSRRYVLQYKLYVAQDVSLEERIEVLEELKKRDYREKWAYELAYLYHRVGLGTKCVEECDELILWFGEGRYVYKAMELKMLHQPLTPVQQQKYETRFGALAPEPVAEKNPSEELPVVTQADEAAAIALGETREFHAVTDEELANLQVHTNVGEYNTIDLQAAIAEGVQQVMENGDEDAREAVTRSILAPMYDTTVVTDAQGNAAEESTAKEPAQPEQTEEVEVFFGETGEIAMEEKPAEEPETAASEASEVESASEETPSEETPSEEVSAEGEAEAEDASREALQNTQNVGNVREITGRTVYPEGKAPGEPDVGARVLGLDAVFPAKVVEEALTAQPPEEIADSLTQEADGQISLVMPEDQKIVKQITGQLSIADVMLEWERMKKESEERNREQRYQEVKAQTGKMFNEFEAAVMNSVLEKLEREADEEIKARAADVITTEDEVEEIEEIQEQAEETAEPEAEEVLEETFEEETAEEELAEEELSEEEPVEEAPAEESPVEPVPSEGAALEAVLEKELQEATEEAPEEIFEEQAEEAAEEPVEEPEEESVAEPEEEPVAEPEEESVAEPAEEPEEEPAEDPNEKEEAEEAGEAESDQHDEATPVRRELTREEKELFGPYIQSKKAREELSNLLDSISMASYTGNVVLAGDDGTDLVGLATQIMKEVKLSDSNFSGKVAKITGKGLNGKKVDEVLGQLQNGGLIIEGAAELSDGTANALKRYLEAENRGAIVILTDVRRNMDRFRSGHKELLEMFNASMNVKALSNDKLVAFARQYATELEYGIDEMGMLALHTRIEDRQTNGHAVTVVEAKEIVDRAIRHARRKTPAHFFDVLTGKRYDEEDRIILGEKDFQ